MAMQFAERHRFNADQFFRLAEAGILGEDERVELIDGEILDMSPAGSRHAAAIHRMQDLLRARIEKGMQVRAQVPLRLSDLSAPEPDLAIVRARADYYDGDHPRADDVLLVVEVSESSSPMDRTVKARLYARYGIGEYWVVDVGAGEVVVHTGPQPAGYATVKRYGRGDAWASTALPSVRVTGGDVFG